MYKTIFGGKKHGESTRYIYYRKYSNDENVIDVRQLRDILEDQFSCIGDRWCSNRIASIEQPDWTLYIVPKQLGNLSRSSFHKGFESIGKRKWDILETDLVPGLILVWGSSFPIPYRKHLISWILYILSIQISTQFEDNQHRKTQ